MHERIQLLTQENDLLLEQQTIQGQELDQIRQECAAKCKELTAHRKRANDFAAVTEQSGAAVAQLQAHCAHLDEQLTANLKQLRAVEEENERMHSELQTTQSDLADARQKLANMKQYDWRSRCFII